MSSRHVRVGEGLRAVGLAWGCQEEGERGAGNGKDVEARRERDEIEGTFSCYGLEVYTFHSDQGMVAAIRKKKRGGGRNLMLAWNSKWSVEDGWSNLQSPENSLQWMALSEEVKLHG